MNSWNIAIAKSGFSEMIADAKREPQIITKRNRPVAVVMDISKFEGLEAAKPKVPTVSELLLELRAVQKEEKEVIEIPCRKNRKAVI